MSILLPIDIDSVWFDHQPVIVGTRSVVTKSEPTVLQQLARFGAIGIGRITNVRQEHQHWRDGFRGEVAFRLASSNLQMLIGDGGLDMKMHDGTDVAVVRLDRLSMVAAKFSALETKASALLQVVERRSGDDISSALQFLAEATLGPPGSDEVASMVPRSDLVRSEFLRRSAEERAATYVDQKRQLEAKLFLSEQESAARMQQASLQAAAVAYGLVAFGRWAAREGWRRVEDDPAARRFQLLEY